jgi:hypothetical protein
MRLIGMLIFVGIFAGSALAETTFHFDTGEGWRGEQMVVPPRFAPKMAWKGAEDIRFAPGMYREPSEMFFTYAFVMLLEEGSDVSAEALQREVLLYFQGLARAVSRGKGKVIDFEKFALEIVKSKEGEEREKTEYSGTLDWVEPFKTLEPQKLNLEIAVWKHGERPALFFGVSPKARDHANWTELRRIRETFRFED